MVIEAHSPATALYAKHPILLSKIFNDPRWRWFIHPETAISKNRNGSSTLCVFKTHCRGRPSRSSEISHLHADPVFRTIRHGDVGRLDFERLTAFLTDDCVTVRSGRTNFARQLGQMTVSSPYNCKLTL
jgi:hypothetical protein